MCSHDLTSGLLVFLHNRVLFVHVVFVFVHVVFVHVPLLMLIVKSPVFGVI